MNRFDRGFGMIEVLVTLVIVALGLLGLAGLHTRAQQSEMEAYQRSQALVLLRDMVDRLNSNRPAAGCYAFTDAAQGSPFAGVGNSAGFACSAYGTTASQAVANADLSAWDAALKGSSETSGGNSVGAMIGARGCISRDPVSGIYTVAVAWQGLSDTVAATANCAQGQYGSSTKRRVIATRVVLADLE